MATSRASQLIEQLKLQPHPEGGYYREIYRSDTVVRPAAGHGERAAVTTIFFLLTQGQFSCLHRVDADEIWHFYEGDPLELVQGTLNGESCERRRLGPAEGETLPVQIVPAGVWQAARSTGAYTLAGCTVAPGFDFRGFRMLRDDSVLAARVKELYPELRDLI